MLSKKLLAVIAASTVSLCSEAAPLKLLKQPKNTNHSLPISQTDLPVSQRIDLSGGHSAYRLITLGDSLSDIGNIQLLLEVLNRDADAELLFKPLNKDQRFLKLLSYLNLPLKDVGIAEDLIANVILDVINHLVIIPIYPDDKYYSGPEGHKNYGRFSNGPVWSEWFGQMLLGNDVSNELSYINRAYGGSWASKLGDQKIDWTLDIPELVNSIVDYIDGKLLPPNMHYLVSAFLDEYPVSKGGEAISVLYGANDYLNNDYSKPESKANPRANPTTLVRDIHQEITRLADWAADTADDAPRSFIYVSNLPDMSKAPTYASGGKNGQGGDALTDIKQHNQLLESMVVGFQKQSKYQGKIEFRYTDLFSMFDKVYDTLPAKNKTEACYPNDMLQSPSLVLNAKAVQKQPPVEPCKNPDDYFFWDAVHPTRQVHAELSYSLCLEVAKDIASIHCFKPDWKNEQSYPVPAFNP